MINIETNSQPESVEFRDVGFTFPAESFDAMNRKMRVRCALVGIVLLVIGFTGVRIANWVYNCRSQHAAEVALVEAVANEGGHCYWAFNGAGPRPGEATARLLGDADLFNHVFMVDFKAGRPTPDVLYRFDDFRLLSVVDFTDVDVSDDDMSFITSCPQLRLAWLGGTHVGDRTAVALSTRDRLKNVSLNDTEVTSDGIIQVLQAPNLHQLICGPEISREALKAMYDHSTLRHVSLYFRGVPPVLDDAPAHLTFELVEVD